MLAYTGQLCKNGGTDQDVVWGHSCASRKPVVLVGGSRSYMGRDSFMRILSGIKPGGVQRWMRRRCGLLPDDFRHLLIGRVACSPCIDEAYCCCCSAICVSVCVYMSLCVCWSHVSPTKVKVAHTRLPTVGFRS